jgi:hypothetical protein
MNAPRTAIMRVILATAVVFGLGLAATASAQLQFTGISATPEQAIQITWASISNETYEIDEADTLETNAQGTITWNLLYDDYPSQGSNTFWLDTGNYTLVPTIVHPKYTTNRFYRVVDKGPDTTSDEPKVTVTTLTNGAVVSDELTVSLLASTDQSFLVGTKLYVDGQEMRAAESTTNYVSGSTNYELDTYAINTCEWRNGTHILFGTVECQSANAVTINPGPVGTGHGVSPFVTASFSNLVTGISFSQASFNPSAGQTQQVTAIFAANCNWTLDIVDISSNVVLTTTGSGGSMSYNWDGTGSGGTNLPNGIYYYYITAQTNGQPLGSGGGGTNGGGGSGPPSGDFASPGSPSNAGASELWAQPVDGSGIAVPLILYPPGFDTNGLRIFEASPSWNPTGESVSASPDSVTVTESGGGFSPDYSGGPSQSAPPAPQRPPNNPVRGLQGTFGVGCDTYAANGTSGVSMPPLLDGSGAGTHISMEGLSASRNVPFGPMSVNKFAASVFVSQMQGWGWNNSLYEVDDQLKIGDLRGSTSPFNNVNLVFLSLHCAYGTSPDYAANQCKQMYYPITSGGSAQYLRMSEMNLGAAGTNGLKWIGIDACFSLYQANWNSMRNAGVNPYNSNLHLLLGSATDCYPSLIFGKNWAQYMNYGTNGPTSNPMTIRASWYQAARDADAIYKQSLPDGASSAVMAVAGDTACMNDMLQTNNSPTGTWTYDSQQVWP